MLKAIILAMLSAILPLIYTNLIGAVPDFPLAGDKFAELLIWAIGYLVGGWQLNKAKALFRK